MRSNTTAVGLLSARSIKDSAERLTPDWVASASNDMPSSERSARTRAAMRSLTEVCESISIIVDKVSTKTDASTRPSISAGERARRSRGGVGGCQAPGIWNTRQVVVACA